MSRAQSCTSLCPFRSLSFLHTLEPYWIRSKVRRCKKTLLGCFEILWSCVSSNFHQAKPLSECFSEAPTSFQAISGQWFSQPWAEGQNAKDATTNTYNQWYFKHHFASSTSFNMIQCSTAFNMVQQVLECLRNFLVELSLQNFRCLQQGNFTEQCREVQTLRLELLLRLQLGADPGGSWGPFRKTPTWNLWNIRNLRKKSLNHAELAQLKPPRKITTTTIGSECTLPNPQEAALINAATPTRTAVIIMNCLSKKLIERRWKANRRLTKSQAQWPKDSGRCGAIGGG